MPRRSAKVRSGSRAPGATRSTGSIRPRTRDPEDPCGNDRSRRQPRRRRRLGLGGHPGHREPRRADAHRFDAATGETEARIALPAGGEGVIASDGFIWVTSPLTGQISKVDPETNTRRRDPRGRRIAELHRRRRRRALGGRPARRIRAADRPEIRFGGGEDRDRRDRRTGRRHRRRRRVRLGRMGARSTATQIDPATNTVVARYASSCPVFSMRYGAGSVWVAGPDLLRLRISGVD